MIINLEDIDAEAVASVLSKALIKDEGGNTPSPVINTRGERHAVMNLMRMIDRQLESSIAEKKGKKKP